MTGEVGSVTARSVALSGGVTRFGVVNLLAQLDDVYARQVQQGLASLEKGRSLTVVGRFVFDKMWLVDAILVDSKTGKPLSPEEIAAPISPIH